MPEAAEDEIDSEEPEIGDTRGLDSDESEETDEGEDVVASSCIYESTPASNMIFSSDSKMSSSTAKSAGFTKVLVFLV